MRKPIDRRPAILRALKKRPMSLTTLVIHLGAQDRWDAVQRALQQLRKDGAIEYLGKKWQIRVSR